MSALLSEQQVSDYRRDGVILLRQFLDPGWLETLAEGIAENLRAPSRRSTALVDDAASNQTHPHGARAWPGVLPGDRRGRRVGPG